MQKIKDFCKRHRLLWLTLLVALAAAAVAAWAGFDLGQRVDNQPVYEIVNDDYTRTVVIPATADAATQDDGTTGLYLPVPIKSGQRIYGVRLDLTTHNWAFRHGTLYAALLDADGNAVANGELDCITIKDNTFAAITFDAPYTAPGTADAEEDYDLANPNMTLRLWYTPGDDWDVYHMLGLWTDADTSQQMTRRNANGTTDSIVGHPALQYVVNDSGSWSHVISRLLGVLTFAAVVAGFILLTHRAKLWQVVLVCGAVLGVAFAFLTPPLVGPDEYTHLAKCYRQSSTLLGQPVADDDDMLLVRSCDAPYFKNHTGDIGIYAYKEMLEHLGDAGCSGETTVSSDTYVTADPINNTLYLGQIAGITLARMMGLGFHGMLLLGRLCNLALYLALAAAAVNIAPQRLRGPLAGNGGCCGAGGAHRPGQGNLSARRAADLYDSRCQPCLARQALAGWPHCQSSGAGAGRYRLGAGQYGRCFVCSPRCGYRGHPARRWCRRGWCRFAGAAVLEDPPRPQKEENLFGCHCRGCGAGHPGWAV